MGDIWQGAGIWQGWRLTTDHAASSYNQPVLVDPDGKAYGPGDIMGAQLIGQKEIGELLGWSKQQVNNYYKDGRLPDPDQVIAGRPAWARSKIEAYQEARSRRDRFGSVTLDGKEYTLLQEAYLDYINRPLDGGAMLEGNFYRAAAIDSGGNQFEVIWSPVEDYESIEDGSDHCDWDRPDWVLPL